MSTPGTVTRLLLEWKQGDQSALDKLIPLVYQELHHIANIRLMNERSNNSLQPTALVHEAYIRLIGCDNIDWQNRAHLFGVAAQLMRNILVDRARQQLAAKRGGERFQISLGQITELADRKDLDLIALDDALNVLAKLDPQQVRIIEMRYFAGLSIAETAEVLGISTATISREWHMAKLWLLHELDRTGQPESFSDSEDTTTKKLAPED